MAIARSTPPTLSRLTVLVLAAGKGTRLRSKTIKLLHGVAGRPMVAHVVAAARALRPRRLITVVGHQADQVREALADSGPSFVLQRQQRGTGHAVLQAARQIGADSRSTLLILNGDLPTLRVSTLRRLVRTHQRNGAALSVMTAELADPARYGRIVRDGRGRFERIVEYGDATKTERAIREVNCGIYCADPGLLIRTLRRVRPDNAQSEYYITDAVQAIAGRGGKVAAVLHSDAQELLGVNDREELAAAARTLYARKAEELQAKGVTLLDASRTWIDPAAKVGRDTIIFPDVIIEGATVIGGDCVIRPGCRLSGSWLGRGVEIKDHSVVLDSRVGNGAAVGPFAHLRPGTRLEAESKVGNFVELKKTTLGRRAKANHLTYLGDAEIGAGSNVGAGTITCNYDGTHKHRTTLGRGTFIGSGTQLVAPIKIADGAYVAAGSTLTKDVPSGALAVARGRQLNVEGWVARRAGKAGKKRRPSSGKSRKR